MILVLTLFPALSILSSSLLVPLLFIFLTTITAVFLLRLLVTNIRMTLVSTTNTSYVITFNWLNPTRKTFLSSTVGFVNSVIFFWSLIFVCMLRHLPTTLCCLFSVVCLNLQLTALKSFHQPGFTEGPHEFTSRVGVIDIILRSLVRAQ